MKKVGDIIPECFRNCGASFGLSHPYIFANDLMNWIVWHRETGEVVHIEQEPNPCLAEVRCSRECRIRNGFDPDYVDPAVIAAIDETP